MSESNTIKVLRLADGRVFQEMDDGTLRPLASQMDWTRFDAMTDEEVEANALSDSDNPPWTEEELQRLRPVPNTKRIRASLHLTQEQFADSFNLPLGTVRDWELGRRQPDTAARNFLRVIEHNPHAVIEALKR
ncbi:MAG: helix-turn-helix domain-containing protein [Thermomicrobiales bacterium]|nr:helix-turn-helix domain-containing protein [Thermomicrobiales bacterium]